MEEGNQSGDLAISGGHGNAQEEYAMRRRREDEAQLPTQMSLPTHVPPTVIAQTLIVDQA